ncbi:MAG: oligosaccharide flippase family protein [Gemmatimonadetes bacterium]|nr:oligosaccharide flippase family protein [Gemmatimonadota bacterium]
MTDAAAPAGAAAVPASEGQPAGGYVRSTFKHGAVYLIGTVLSRVAGFIMLPVYTRVLTPRDYGVMEMLAYTTDVLTFLVGLGVSTAVTRHYYKYETEAERHALVSTAAVLLFVLFAVVAVPVLFLAEPITSLLLKPGEPALFIRLSMVSLILGVAIDVPMTVMRARQESQQVVLWGAIRLLLAIVLNLVFVVWLRMGVLGVLLSTIISGGAVGGYLVSRLLRITGLHFQPAMARALVAFGAPFAIWELGSFVLHFSDRFFLNAYSTLETVGLYSLSYKVAIVIPFFITGPFSSIWLPKALEIEKREGVGAIPILSAIQRHYNLLLICIAFGMALFAWDAIRLATGEAFHGAYAPVPLLALAMVFFGYRQTAQIGVIIREKPGLVARSTAVAAAAVLLLNWILIPRFGAMGAAAATLGGFGTEFFIMRWFSMREYPLRIEVGLLPLAIGVVAWAGTRAVLPLDASVPLSLAINAGGFVAFTALLLVTGAVDREQRQFLLAAVRDPRGMLRAVRGG